jgi:alcohol dehydrogenase (cytochrome c)
VLVYPGNAGATNWWPSSYSERLGLVFVPVWEGGGWYFRDPELDRSDGLFAGGRVLPVPGERAEHSIIALEVSTGKIRWRAPLLTLPHGAKSGGLLSIGDRLVLGSEETNLVVLDARTGHRVWQQNLGADIGGAPMTFRVNGKPRLAVTAGSVLFVFDVGRESAPLAERRPGSEASEPAAPTARR